MDGCWLIILEGDKLAGFSLNRVIVVSFVFLGLFTLLFQLMPSEYFSNQTDYAAPTTYENEVAKFYSTHNLTLYKNQWNFNITRGGHEYLENVPAQDHRIECYWDFEYIYYEGGAVGMMGVIYFEHSWPSWFFGLWRESHKLELTGPYQVETIYYSENNVGHNLPYWAISKERLLQLAKGKNYTFFEMSCGHITANFVITPTNASWTLEQAWDNGKLHVMMSYEIDWEAMKPTAWTLIGQLLTFKAPDLGVPGIGGQILSYMIGAVLWVAIAITIYTIATRLIPAVRGGVEG